MTLSLEKLHEHQERMNVLKSQLPALRYRHKRAGAFKTKDRIQAEIDSTVGEMAEIVRILLRSWVE